MNVAMNVAMNFATLSTSSISVREFEAQLIFSLVLVKRQVGAEEVEDHLAPVERRRRLVGDRRELRDLRLVELVLGEDELRDPGLLLLLERDDEEALDVVLEH